MGGERVSTFVMKKFGEVQMVVGSGFEEIEEREGRV